MTTLEGYGLLDPQKGSKAGGEEANDFFSPLKARERKVVQAVLETASLTAAAKQAGIPYSSLRRILRRARVREALRKAEVEALAEVLGRLRTAASRALDTLCELSLDPDAPPPVRLQAASKVLEITLTRWK